MSLSVWEMIFSSELLVSHLAMLLHPKPLTGKPCHCTCKWFAKHLWLVLWDYCIEVLSCWLSTWFSSERGFMSLRFESAHCLLKLKCAYGLVGSQTLLVWSTCKYSLFHVYLIFKESCHWFLCLKKTSSKHRWNDSYECAPFSAWKLFINPNAGCIAHPQSAVFNFFVWPFLKQCKNQPNVLL